MEKIAAGDWAGRAEFSWWSWAICAQRVCRPRGGGRLGRRGERPGPGGKEEGGVFPLRRWDLAKRTALSSWEKGGMRS